ncbi:MAG: hypothetical protein DLM50_08440 [Candidatus Meridianibacter frigidus]|nr:MAG: hypothetical protein DLM50_08440 [Candidatus Eremiobacteraeota bacterium]
MKLHTFSKALNSFAGPMLAGALALNSLAAAPALAAQTGLAYDEVTKIVIGGPQPQPGTFAADFQAAVDAQKSLATPGSHRGLFGNIMNSMDMAKNAMSMLKTGTATTHYYLGGWERSDDAGAQTATISKFDRHQMIYLNLAKKTYRVVDTSVAPAMETPPPMERARGGGQPSQPGSGKLDISVSSNVLGPLVVENTPTTGYSTTFNLTMSQSTGSCSDGSFKTAMIEYVSRYLQPRVGSPRVGSPRAAMPRQRLSRPELAALRPGCTPTMSMHAMGGAQPPAGRLALWTLVTVSGSAPSAQGPMSGGFSTLIERGNIRALGPADKSLFEIPAGFTPEQ